MSASVEKLEKARKLIARPGGWTQGEYFESNRDRSITLLKGPPQFDGCAVCLVGALAVACRASKFSLVEYSHEAQLIAEAIGCNTWSLVGWNDEIDRTQQDVIQAYDRAIELARAS